MVTGTTTLMVARTRGRGGRTRQEEMGSCLAHYLAVVEQCGGERLHLTPSPVPASQTTFMPKQTATY